MADYDFRTLSPIDFEVFARQLLNAELKSSLVTYSVGPDGGIDLRDLAKSIVAQCKHRPDLKKSGLLAAIEAERGKIDPAKYTTYVFVTTATVTPDVEIEARRLLASFGFEQVDFWHRGKLNSALEDHGSVERDNFKLWLSSSRALEKLFEGPVAQRSEARIGQLRSRVSLYVHTGAFRESMDLLRTERVVMISGAPGVGKTTLAEMLLLNLWDQGWRAVDIGHDVNDAWAHMRDQDDKVVFYYDDFLGQTNIAELQKNESSEIALLIEQVRSAGGRKLLVLTTREQILKAAAEGPDDRVSRLALSPSKFLVEIDAMTRIQKAEILYNHLYFHASENEREALRGSTDLLAVVDHRNFNPRIIQSVVVLQAHSSAEEIISGLRAALENPQLIWQGSFRQLSETASRVLFFITATPYGRMAEGLLKAAIGPSSGAEWNRTLKLLDDSWVRIDRSHGFAEVVLYDPSRKDYLLGLLDEIDYLEDCWRMLATLEQVAYLCRVYGVVEGGSTGGRWLSRRGGATQSRWIGERVEAKVDELIAALLEAESTLSVTELTTLAELCAQDKLLVGPHAILEDQCDAMFEGAAAEVYMSASRLLSLAVPLSADSMSVRSHALAFKLTIAALDGFSDLNDLNAIEHLGYDFRNGIHADELEHAIQAVVDLQADGLSQQDDPDVMLSWAEELEMLAENVGAFYSADSVREEVATMEPSGRENSALGINSTPIQRTGDNESSDESLRLLFERL